jgi:uncharacterized RmlC-like cupin family protein
MPFEKTVLLPEQISLRPGTQFALDDVDLILQAGLHAGKVTITDSKRTLNCHSHVIHYDRVRSSTLRLSTIHDLILNGYTLRLFGANEYSTDLDQLSKYIESIVGRRVHVNVYLTGPNVQGLAAHADPHDVLIYQLSGTKHWFIELERGRGFHDFNIMPGQMLFMPQGVQHYAANEDNSHSLHLAISLHNAVDESSELSTPHARTLECTQEINEYLLEACRDQYGVRLNRNQYFFLVPRILGKDLIFSSAQDLKEASVELAVSQLLKAVSSSFELRGIEYIFPELLPTAFSRDISFSLRVQCIKGTIESELVAERVHYAEKSYFSSALKHRLFENNDCMWVLNPSCVLKPSGDVHINASASTTLVRLPIELAKCLQNGPTRLDDEVAQRLARSNVVVPA